MHRHDGRTGWTGLDGASFLTTASAISGTPGSDTLTGGTGDETLYGGNGNDSLSGGFGLDTLYGGKGDDRAFGDDGDDLIYGGAGNDFILGDNLEGENGGTPASGNDRIYGGAGDDYIDGKLGDDTQFGGTGNDVLTTGGGNDLVYGGAGNDATRSGGGDDDYFGGAGNDTLADGLGADDFIGGSGADTFMYLREEDVDRDEGPIFQGYGVGNDRILDFDLAEGDRIVIDTYEANIVGFDDTGTDLIVTISDGETLRIEGFTGEDFAPGLRFDSAGSSDADIQAVVDAINAATLDQYGYNALEYIFA